MSVKMKLLSGTSNPKLAQDIANYLSIRLTGVEIKQFSDGEKYVEITDNIRGRDVFIIQSTSSPANDNIIELALLADAARGASAERITAVIPYYGYARQDRKSGLRTPISSKTVAKMLSQTGIDRVVTMDLHAEQIQGFFDIPVDHIFATGVLVEKLRQRNIQKPLIVSPDVGGTRRARVYGKRLDAGLAIIDKRRPEANVSVVHHIIGEVEDKDCIIVDDMVDTAGTLVKATDALLEQGARSVRSVATHGVLSGPALERIENSKLEELIITDTIYVNIPDNLKSKIVKASVSNLLGETVRRIYNEESISCLFNGVESWQP